jgi:hypothetical protein
MRFINKRRFLKKYLHLLILVIKKSKYAFPVFIALCGIF